MTHTVVKVYTIVFFLICMGKKIFIWPGLPFLKPPGWQSEEVRHSAVGMPGRGRFQFSSLHHCVVPPLFRSRGVSLWTCSTSRDLPRNWVNDLRRHTPPSGFRAPDSLSSWGADGVRENPDLKKKITRSQLGYRLAAAGLLHTTDCLQL